MRSFYVFGLAAILAACGGSDDPDPTITPVAPTQVDMVASGNFEAPMDAVASPDGTTFYFSAHDTTLAPDVESTAAIFAVPSAGGTAEALVSGAPLEDPTGLLMSCDGATLYIADLSFDSLDATEEADEDKSALYTLDLATNALAALPATGIGEAASLAFDTDCSTLYVTGYTPDRTPAVFTLAPEGGAATILASGAPLESPSGVYVDVDHIAWVMDHVPSNHLGGALFAIDPAGVASVVVDGLEISEPAGVSLVAGGDITIIPSRDIDGQDQLITVSTSTGESNIVAAPEILEPAGIRTATQASIMAVVDNDGDAIFRAQ